MNMKEYYEKEISLRETPPMPQLFTKRRKQKSVILKWDSIFLAACILGSFILILLPSSYDNAIRKSYIPISKYEAFKEEFHRIIFDASLYFQDR